MYTVKTAYGKSHSGDGNWESITLNDLQCSQLFNTYQDVVANFEDSYRPDRTFGLRLTEHLDLFTTFKGTFKEYLASLGNKSLPLQDGQYVIEKGVIEYEDAVRAKYKLYPIGDKEALDADIPRLQKTDLLLKKEKKDKDYYKQFHDHVLVSVGGYYHMVDYSHEGVHVIDGMKTLNRHPAGTPLVGFTSFDKVGKLEYIPIKKDMIYIQSNGGTLYDRTHIKLDQDISDKTFMISIGGYLHILDWMTCRRVGDNVISIDFKNMPLFERIYESMRYLDMSDLPLNPGYNEAHLDPEIIMSDDFIKAYLTMSQSFIVLIDTPDIYVNRIGLRLTKLPYQYISYVYPNYPLVNGIGKVCEYWSIYDEGIWEVNAFENFKHNRVFDTTNYREDYAVTGNRTTWDRTEHSKAYFLEIGKQSAVFKPNKP